MIRFSVQDLVHYHAHCRRTTGHTVAMGTDSDIRHSRRTVGQNIQLLWEQTVTRFSVKDPVHYRTKQTVAMGVDRL